MMQINLSYGLHRIELGTSLKSSKADIKTGAAFPHLARHPASAGGEGAG
jgi:hypothetical protein